MPGVYVGEAGPVHNPQLPVPAHAPHPAITATIPVPVPVSVLEQITPSPIPVPVPVNELVPVSAPSEPPFDWNAVVEPEKKQEP